ISYSPERFSKEIAAASGRTGKVTVKRFKSSGEQYRWTADTVMRLPLEHDLELSDIAVLVRTHSGARGIVRLLKAQGVYIKLDGEDAFLSGHTAVMDMFSYLRAAEGTAKRADLLRIINKPDRGIAREEVRRGEVPKRLEEDLAALRGLSPIDAIRRVRHLLGYDEHIRYTCERSGAEPDRYYKALDRLEGCAVRTRGVNELEEAAGKLAADPADTVNVLTLHKAKGLEFKTVFIADAQKTNMPHRTAKDAKELAEERRLFYVGMTRAIHSLIIIYTDKDGKAASPYLSEMKKEKRHRRRPGRKL
ncbi:MAG: ATP-dependent helicase, partial [Synergistes sp.]|nr:ATP-dependent helicase [Synergistes sp.]